MVGQCVRNVRNVSLCINHLEAIITFILEIRVSQKLAKPRGVGKGHKTTGMEGGERIGVNCVAWEGGFQCWL